MDRIRGIIKKLTEMLAQLNEFLDQIITLMGLMLLFISIIT